MCNLHFISLKKEHKKTQQWPKLQAGWGMDLFLFSPSQLQLRGLEKEFGEESCLLNQEAGWVFSCYWQRDETCKFCCSLSFIISDDLAANAKNKFSCFIFEVVVVQCLKTTPNLYPRENITNISEFKINFMKRCCKPPKSDTLHTALAL